VRLIIITTIQKEEETKKCFPKVLGEGFKTNKPGKVGLLVQLTD
jgi:hypothetical protein